MLHFTPLIVSAIRRETPESVSVGVTVPSAQIAAFTYKAGQFLTFRATIDGEEVRRSYSLCAPPSVFASTHTLWIAAKEVSGGKFSTYLNRTLQVGDTLEVMPPDGNFVTEMDEAQRRHVVAFAGGSGITPILALISTILETEPQSRCTLVYGNRAVSSIMFAEALEDLKNRYLHRLSILHVISDEPQDAPIFEGLLNREKSDALLAQLIAPETIDLAFICGPDPMMNATEAALLHAGVDPKRIRIERFGVPMPASAVVSTPSKADAETTTKTTLDIVADGKQRRIPIFATQTVLDAGLRAGLPLPYACKAGVCCTCKAKLISGHVRMEKNFTLSEQEIAQGFVLTCQSVCVSPEVVVSYDER